MKGRSGTILINVMGLLFFGAIAGYLGAVSPGYRSLSEAGVVIVAIAGLMTLACIVRLSLLKARQPKCKKCKRWS